MPIVQNPVYFDKQLAGTMQNLGTAIFGENDPEKLARGRYYGAESARAIAEAAKYKAETDAVTGRTAAQQSITPEMVASLAWRPGETASQHFVRTTPLMTAMGRMGVSADDVSKAFNNGLTEAYAQSPSQADAITALKLQGKATDQNYVGVPSQAAIVSQRLSDAAARLANIHEAGDTQRNTATIGGENWRHINTPVIVAPGATAQFATTDQRHQQFPQGIKGQPNKGTVEGEAGERMLAGDNNPVLGKLFAGTAAGLGLGGGGKQPLIPQQQIDKIELDALKNVKGALGGTATKPALQQDFMDTLGPENRRAGQQAASAAYILTHDPVAASTAYLRGAGLAAGSTFTPESFPKTWTPGADDKGTITDPSGADITNVTPAASAAPPSKIATTVSTPSAIPTVTSPDQLPTKRDASTVVNIQGKGQVRWNPGTNSWLPVQPMAPAAAAPATPAPVAPAAATPPAKPLPAPVLTALPPGPTGTPQTIAAPPQTHTLNPDGSVAPPPAAPINVRPLQPAPTQAAMPVAPGPTAQIFTSSAGINDPDTANGLLRSLDAGQRALGAKYFTEHGNVGAPPPPQPVQIPQWNNMGDARYSAYNDPSDVVKAAALKWMAQNSGA